MTFKSKDGRHGIQNSVGQFAIEAPILHPGPQLGHEEEIAAGSGVRSRRDEPMLDAADVLIDDRRLDADLTLGLLQTGDVLTEMNEPDDPFSNVQLRQREIQQIHHVQFHIVRENTTLSFPAQKKKNQSNNFRLKHKR